MWCFIWATAHASPSTIRAALARWTSCPRRRPNSTRFWPRSGPEPLGNAFHEAHLVERLKGRNTPVKSALLDQKIVAGLGNIYVCEALYRARIHPARKVGRISGIRVAALVPIIRQVLAEAIEAGGSSLRDFRQTDGELGYFQHSFDVYGREGQPCRTPGCPGYRAPDRPVRALLLLLCDLPKIA